MKESYIENCFREKSLGTANEILFNQWKIDKLLVSKMLERVKDFFPHYTNHDISHSEVILNNIYLLLGKDSVERLSVSDLWLLLQVSYFHDIGMIIDVNTINVILDNKDFIKHIEYIKNEKNHPLHLHSEIFDIKDKKLFFTSKTFGFNKLIYPKYLIADFLRRHHGKAMNNVVKNVFKEEFINRENSLISKRLYELIYKISILHTKSFENIFDVPISENGYGIDKCHPRMIAGLLRLGDLLDLESNRYDKFMDKFLIDIPEDTVNHIKKHSSIETLNIDNETVSILSTVSNYNVYVVMNDWFNWIKDEFTNQHLNWHKIVPNKMIGTIPLIKNIEVKLENYSLLPGGEIPHFTLSSEKALDLIQGSHIYENEGNYFREIIQNAIDSTYIKVFLDKEKQGIQEIEFPNDSLPKLDVFKNYELKITLKKNEALTKEKNDDSNYYTFKIRDKGIGISSEEIKFLLNVATSQENDKKQEIIERMPKYLRPSGNFGIGFQSIFNITDRVSINSKSYFTNEEIFLDLYNPNKKNNVLYKVCPSTTNQDSYFELSFDYRVKKIATSCGLARYDDKKYEYISSYDFIYDEEFDVDIYSIYSYIKESCYNSYFLNVQIDFLNSKFELNPTDKGRHYLSHDGNFVFKFTGVKKDRDNLFFKGQSIKNSVSYISSIGGLEVDLVGYKAKDLLNFSRTELSANAKSTDLFEVMNKQIMLLLESLDSKPEELENFQEFFYLNVFARTPNFKKKSKFLNYNLNDLSDYGGFDITFKMILNLGNNLSDIINALKSKDKIEVSYKRVRNGEYDFIEYIVMEYENQNIDICLSRNNKYEIESIIDFIVYELIKDFKIFYIPKDREYAVILSKNEIHFEKSYYKGALEYLKKIVSSPRNRATWICIEKYMDLALNYDKISKNWIYIPDTYSRQIDILLMPVFFKERPGFFSEANSQFDVLTPQFLDFIYDNQKCENGVNRERIRDLYEQLLEEMK